MVLNTTQSNEGQATLLLTDDIRAATHALLSEILADALKQWSTEEAQTIEERKQSIRQSLEGIYGMIVAHFSQREAETLQSASLVCDLAERFREVINNVMENYGTVGASERIARSLISIFQLDFKTPLSASGGTSKEQYQTALRRGNEALLNSVREKYPVELEGLEQRQSFCDATIAELERLDDYFKRYAKCFRSLLAADPDIYRSDKKKWPHKDVKEVFDYLKSQIWPKKSPLPLAALARFTNIEYQRMQSFTGNFAPYHEDYHNLINGIGSLLLYKLAEVKRSQQV